jgi:ubiquinone biosynthesis UbiH/UbiF/VisC/COQ6 family hydroxylase
MEISMDYDVIIIGAGPAGLSFARSLANTKLRILLIEKSPLGSIEDPAEDGREIALTHLSVKLMKKLGAWDRIEPDGISPIKTAKVLNGDSAYSLDFTRPAKSLEALGYLVPNHLIRKAFYNEVATFKNIKLITDSSVIDVKTNSLLGSVTLSTDETLTASLIVSSDSRFSETRRKMGISSAMQDFSRTAIICRMEHELSHQQTAFECFHYGKTMALLPMNGNLSSVVITVSNHKVDSLLKMTDEQFNSQVQQWFGNKLGKISLVGKRHSYPLIAVHADKFVSNRYALVGDASVGMHPVTAHGFNLGLRGADTLAREIKNAMAHGKDIASISVLRKYERKHMRITKFLYHGTNHIVSLFTNETQTAKVIRNTALRIANNFPPVRHLITAKLTETGKMDFLPPLPSFPPLPFKNPLTRKAS